MFESILFWLVLLCAVIILLCKYVFKTMRNRQIEPWYLDYAESFFPVLLVVFLLRSFIVEPFRIPSGSMLPTLEVGDFILVNKYKYGLRLPVIHNKILPLSNPKRGDIMVFRYPGDNTTNYIKRVIGLPGDTIEYKHKRLYLNGTLVENTEDGSYLPFPMRGKATELGKYVEELPERDHAILIDNRSASQSVKRTVPEKHYFVMGDNRDHSLDSRYWGFVPDENVVGNAFFVWFHWNSHPGGGVKLARVGTDI